MGILVDKTTNLIVQGISGRQGRFHTRLMMEYGTNIVAGITPGQGNNSIYGIPIYDTVGEALTNHDIDASIVFVPATSAKDAVFEAIESRLKLIIIITEHIPIHDAIEMKELAIKHGSKILGPNTPGILVPRKCKVGIMPTQIFTRGKIGVVSRSGTLTYEIVSHLSKKHLGQSACVGIGGDRVIGMSFIDILRLFEEDNETDNVVLIGEIGGYMEEEAAEYIKKYLTKPVVAFIAGKTAPIGRRMGHSGAIIDKGRGTAESKINAFNICNIPVAKTPKEAAELISKHSR